MRNQEQTVDPVNQQVPEDKRTSLELYVTARAAYEMWQVDPENVWVMDVRTPEEYLFVGHAEMAWNVPVALQSYVWDASKGLLPMQPLPDFVARAQRVAKPADRILVMCRSGGRSAIAVNLLAQAGFNNAYQIIDGMEGDAVADPDSIFQGQRLRNGWKNSGCPWTYKIVPQRLVLPTQQA